MPRTLLEKHLSSSMSHRKLHFVQRDLYRIQVLLCICFSTAGISTNCSSFKELRITGIPGSLAMILTTCYKGLMPIWKSYTRSYFTNHIFTPRFLRVQPTTRVLLEFHHFGIIYISVGLVFYAALKNIALIRRRSAFRWEETWQCQGQTHDHPQ